MYRSKPPHVQQKTTNYSSNLDSCIKMHHGQQRLCKEGQEHCEWEGVTVSLTSLLQSSSASHIWMKNRLLNISRLNYAPGFSTGLPIFYILDGELIPACQFKLVFSPSSKHSKGYHLFCCFYSFFRANSGNREKEKE